jgi:hemerythrin-like metal-binding protein
MSVRTLLSRMRVEKMPAQEAPSGGAFLDGAALGPVGVAKIDDQHCLLAGLISRLHTTLVVQRDRGASEEVFRSLLLTARDHFAFEESLLVEHHFPKVQDHIAQHSEALEELQAFHRHFRLGTLSATLLLAGLRTWMLLHTQESDQRHARWLSALGHAQI